jgi:hypothetical protein
VWQQVYQKVVITLSGETFSSNSTSYPVAGIRIDSDGNLYKITGTYLSESYTQIDTVNDWCRPVGKAGEYEVKVEENSVGGSAVSPSFDSPAGSGNKGLSTWYACTSDRDWVIRHNETNDTAIWNITVHIRKASTGDTKDTGVFDMTAVEITI